MTNQTRPDATPQTQTAAAGGPPRPPKKTARGLEDDWSEEPHIDLPEQVFVRDIASKLNVKPFVVVGDLMKFGIWANADETVDFETASKVLNMYGLYARLMD